MLKKINKKIEPPFLDDFLDEFLKNNHYHFILNEITSRLLIPTFQAQCYSKDSLFDYLKTWSLDNGFEVCLTGMNCHSK